MKHPFFRNHSSRVLYSSIWMLIFGIQTFTVFLSTDLSFGLALIDSLVFDAILAVCLFPVWYIVLFSRLEYKGIYVILLAHALLAFFVVWVWLGLGFGIMYLFFHGNASYFHFLKASVLWRLLEGVLIYVLLVLVYYLYTYIERLNEKLYNEIRLNNLLKDGELNLLKSQINPHFLFNSLNSVNSLIVKSPQKAQEMLVSLSDYLRYTVLATHQEMSVLQEEIENIGRYLAVEKLRFGDKLLYEFEISQDCLLVKVPSMLLQPLFENAVKHGVYESFQTVRIVAKAKQNAGLLQIEISNDYDTEGVGERKGSGTGLKNIRERLRLLYGNEASLQLRTEHNLFTAILKIPIRKT